MPGDKSWSLSSENSRDFDRRTEATGIVREASPILGSQWLHGGAR